jgi:hypothetical protein
MVDRRLLCTGFAVPRGLPWQSRSFYRLAARRLPIVRVSSLSLLIGGNGLSIDAPPAALPASHQEALVQHPPYPGFGQAKQDRCLADRQAGILRRGIVTLSLVHVLSVPDDHRSKTLDGRLDKVVTRLRAVEDRTVGS